MTRDLAAVIIGAVVAVLAQVVIAPYIAIFSAMPNFLLAYILVVAIVRPGNGVLVGAFFLGFAFDLIGFGPLGAMALLFTLVAYGASRVFRVLNNDTLFMPLIILVASVFAVEVIYAFFLLSSGAASNLAEAFLYRSLPCALYDCVIALAFYPLGLRLFAVGDVHKEASYASPAPNATGVTVQATAPKKRRNRRMK